MQIMPLYWTLGFDVNYDTKIGLRVFLGFVPGFEEMKFSVNIFNNLLCQTRIWVLDMWGEWKTFKQYPSQINFPLLFGRACLYLLAINVMEQKLSDLF